MKHIERFWRRKFDELYDESRFPMMEAERKELERKLHNIKIDLKKKSFVSVNRIAENQLLLEIDAAKRELGYVVLVLIGIWIFYLFGFLPFFILLTLYGLTRIVNGIMTIRGCKQELKKCRK